MRIISAYCVVLLIFSTTPLGIKLSNNSLSFALAITLRMLLALVFCSLLMWLLRKPLVVQRVDWLAFLAGAFGLFPNMLLVYWSAQYISSGLISILFGFFPIFAGLFTWLLLGENILSRAKIIALVMAMGGLWCIHREQVALTPKGAWGILGVFAAVAMWAASVVWIKTLGIKLDPLRQSTGSLLFAAPAFVLYWLIFDGQIPQQITATSWFGVFYLALAGSLIGHTLYFYVLRECTMSATAVITLMSPVLAVIIGYLALHEHLSGGELIGASLIVLSLGFYLGVFAQAWEWLGKRWAANSAAI